MSLTPAPQRALARLTLARLTLARLTLALLTLTPLTPTLSACGGGGEALRAQMDDARRERDALRVAYEAQQLRLKELADRLSALEDRVLALPSRGQRDLSALPVVRLSRRSPPPPQERALPALTADNISDFTPITRRGYEQGPAEGVDGGAQGGASPRRPRAPLPPPPGAEGAASLGVTPLPPRPAEGAPPVLTAPVLTAPVLTAPVLTPLEVTAPLSSTAPLSPPEGAVAPTAAGASADAVISDPFEHALNAARASLREERWAEAKPRFERVLSLAPSEAHRARARYGLALSLKGLGDLPAASALLLELVQADPAGPLVPQALLQVGLIQISSGQEAQGRATLTRLTRLYPNTSAARQASTRLGAQ